MYDTQQALLYGHQIKRRGKFIRSPRPQQDQSRRAKKIETPCIILFNLEYQIWHVTQQGRDRFLGGRPCEGAEPSLGTQAEMSAVDELSKPSVSTQHSKES